MSLLSFIIPAYNAQKYIQRCVNSILKLDSEYSIEIIIVDDGSTDRTLEICEDIKNSDERVRLITQKNGGVSSARNKGISEAHGKYILCIDSDDEFIPECFDHIYLALRSARYDVIAMNYAIYSEDGKCVGISSLDFHSEITGEEIAERYISYPVVGTLQKKCSYLGAKVFQYIIKRSILMKNEIRFPENIGYAEDTCFLYTIMQFSPYIKYIDCLCYKYYVINGSASHSYRAHFSDEIDNMFHYICENSRRKINTLELRTALYNLELQYWACYLNYFQYKSCCQKTIGQMEKEVLRKQNVKGIYFRLYQCALLSRNTFIIYILNRYGEKLSRIKGKIKKFCMHKK